MTADQILVFDMDGVLVDVSESYRETIQRTVEHFTGQRITRALIQEYKNQGGWNDDWSLSTELIRKAGTPVELQDVIDYFQSIFHGDGSDGLILRERWLAKAGLLERLSRRFQLALFTGRERWEAELTLNRYAPNVSFAPIVGMRDVPRPKPYPDGLLQIRASAGERKLWYVGDTVDDARCARSADVPFIGIAARSSPRYDELVGVLKGQDAVAVLDDINQLESVFK